MKRKNEKEFLPGIVTSGRVDTHADVNRHPYEATPYEVLDQLIQSGYITENDILADMGCGKGRVALYLSYKTGCVSTGVEFDRTLYDKAQENLLCSRLKNVRFVNSDATEYEINAETAFFFFNPFSEKIFCRVLNNILISYYENPRRIKLFFYYPDDSYCAILRNTQEVTFIESLVCDGYGKDTRERSDVFVLG